MHKTQLQKKQLNAIENLNLLADSFGKNGTKNISTKFSIDRNSKNIFYNTIHKQSKYTLRGKTYYDMTFHVNFYLKDVVRVYESGNKLHFDLGSRGFTMRVKSPGESWTKTDRIKQNFTLTIYNTSDRKEALKELRYLIKNPKVQI